MFEKIGYAQNYFLEKLRDVNLYNIYDIYYTNTFVM